MFRNLAKNLAKAIVPMVLNEVVLLLEEVIKKDINHDGKIGRNEQ